jgi:hypothetical protein
MKIASHGVQLNVNDTGTGARSSTPTLVFQKSHIRPHYPRALVRYLPDKGHLLPVEASQEVAADIQLFIQQLPE